jgi:hypothetical protein
MRTVAAEVGAEVEVEVGVEVGVAVALGVAGAVGVAVLVDAQATSASARSSEERKNGRIGPPGGGVILPEPSPAG